LTEAAFHFFQLKKTVKNGAYLFEYQKVTIFPLIKKELGK